MYSYGPHIWPSKSRSTSLNIHQLCEDTGCSPEDLPEAMNDREKWRERVRDIRASGTTWWWWRWSYQKFARIFIVSHIRRWQIWRLLKNGLGGLITATRNNTNNTSINRAQITKKQKWEEKQLNEDFKVQISDISSVKVRHDEERETFRGKLNLSW